MNVSQVERRECLLRVMVPGAAPEGTVNAIVVSFHVEQLAEGIVMSPDWPGMTIQLFKFAESKPVPVSVKVLPMAMRPLGGSQDDMEGVSVTAR